MKIKQQIIQYALCTIVFAAFLVICSDDNPIYQMSTGMFWKSKIIALGVIILCVLAGAYLKRRGLIPEPKEDTYEDHWED